jgi:hypothetical protein
VYDTEKGRKLASTKVSWKSWIDFYLEESFVMNFEEKKTILQLNLVMSNSGVIHKQFMLITFINNTQFSSTIL